MSQRIFDLAIELDRGMRNQSVQVHAALRSAIVDGRLAAGAQLPSSRQLAAHLGVRRNAIVAAYEHLVSDGLLEARHGAGTYVANHLPAPRKLAQKPQLDFAPSKPLPFALGNTLIDPGLLSRLSSLLRRRVARAGPEELGYGDPRGSPELRGQIAEHVAAHRGVRCDPANIVIVSGTQHALRLCADALFKPGDAIWMEDPGYYATHTTLRSAGLRIVPVPVDDEGFQMEAAVRSASSVRAAYVTPSHQFPLGVTMSMRRRIALSEWAQATKSWIFEDDYDSEFRFSGPPLTALAGLGGERVIYIGTFSKTLFAGLRLAYLILPPGLVARVVAARAAVDRFPPRFMQDAVADLMADGSLANHIRRVRARYREARDVVVAALCEAAGGALDVRGGCQGLHLVATLKDGATAQDAEMIRREANIEARFLSEARLVPGGTEGFILGYAGYDLGVIDAAARRLGGAAQRIVGTCEGGQRRGGVSDPG